MVKLLNHLFKFLSQGRFAWAYFKISLFTFIIGVGLMLALTSAIVNLFPEMPNGDWIWVNASMAFFIIGIFVITLGYWLVYALKRLEREKQKNAEIAQNAERMRDERLQLMAYVSHEIRNPLNGILGILAIMDRAHIAPHTSQELNMVHENAKDMLTILNDVLDYSKAEHGSLTIDRELIELKPYFHNIAQIWQVNAHNKNLKFTMNFDENLPKFAHIDPVRTKQIIENLCSNAIKYTDEGSIVLSVRCDSMAEGERVEIALWDTGRGVPPELRDKIFHLYEQLPVRREFAPTAGTGLGLLIAKNMAQLMGGDLILAQSSNVGSCFVFTMPLIVSDEKPNDEMNATALQGQNFPKNLSNNVLSQAAFQKAEPLNADMSSGVFSEEALNAKLSTFSALIIDDQESNGLVAQEMLKSFGIRAEYSTNPDEVMQKITSHPPDILLVDDDLGDRRGIEILTHLKPNYQGYIIAYTANIDREYFLNIGFDAVLHKPISRENTAILFQKLFNERN